LRCRVEVYLTQDLNCAILRTTGNVIDPISAEVSGLVRKQNELRAAMIYLDGEGIEVVEHHMVGLWKKGWVTLFRI
jgi:hypothetical protein